MTPHDLRLWRLDMGLEQKDAAAALLMKLSTYQKYEREMRNVGGGKKPTVVPDVVALACAAVKAKLKPYMPPGHLVEVEQDATSPQRLRRIREARKPLALRERRLRLMRRRKDEDVVE